MNTRLKQRCIQEAELLFYRCWLEEFGAGQEVPKKLKADARFLAAIMAQTLRLVLKKLGTGQAQVSDLPPDLDAVTREEPENYLDVRYSLPE